MRNIAPWRKYFYLSFLVINLVILLSVLTRMSDFTHWYALVIINGFFAIMAFLGLRWALDIERKDRAFKESFR